MATQACLKKTIPVKVARFCPDRLKPGTIHPFLVVSSLKYRIFRLYIVSFCLVGERCAVPEKDRSPAIIISGYSSSLPRKRLHWPRDLKRIENEHQCNSEIRAAVDELD